jgi:serine/threonine-protein kinase RsbW
VPPPPDQDEQPTRRGSAGHEAIRDAPASSLRFVLGADFSASSVARDRVEQWLRTHKWPTAQIDELVLAVSEAVSNSVEHGYGVSRDMVDHVGAVFVQSAIITEPDGFRRAEFTVRDTGSWRDRAGGGRRGHGLLIMRSCTDELIIDGSPTGTTVVLRSRPVPPQLRVTR